VKKGVVKPRQIEFVVSSDELHKELAVIFRNIHGRDADELLEALVRERSQPNKAPFPPQLILENTQVSKSALRFVGQHFPYVQVGACCGGGLYALE